MKGVDGGCVASERREDAVEGEREGYPNNIVNYIWMGKGDWFIQRS